MEFIWDQGNINKSVDKHNVTPEQAEQALLNDPIEVQEQLRNGEVRYFHLGETDDGLVLAIVSTERDGKVRVISSRRTSRSERAFYKEERARIAHGEDPKDPRDTRIQE